MDLPSKAHVSSTELEYLAALLALKEGALTPRELTTAVTSLIEGSATSLSSALVNNSSLTTADIRESVEQARLYSELIQAKARLAKAKTRGSANAAPTILFEGEEGATALLPAPQKAAAPLNVQAAQHAGTHFKPSAEWPVEDAEARFIHERPRARSMPLDSQELDSDLPEGAENPDEDFEWRPTSEFLSHFYLLEDSIRSFTGGLLGIPSAAGLLVCLGLGVWGILRAGVFDSILNPPVPIVASGTPDAEAKKFPLRDITLPISRVDAAESDEPTRASELSDAIARMEQSEKAVESNEEDLMLQALVQIEECMKLVNQDINRLDLDMAMNRLEQLRQKRVDALRPSIDTRWLMMGATLLTHKRDDDSLKAAVPWLIPLLQSDNPQARLILARWLVNASPEHLNALETSLRSAGRSANTDMVNWIYATLGNRVDAIDALRARLAEPSSDPLNHLFMSLANYKLGKRGEAKEHLVGVSPYLNRTSYWADTDASPESQWIVQTSLNALKQKCVDLHKKLDLTKGTP
jgi:hypothetical protein